MDSFTPPRGRRAYTDFERRMMREKRCIACGARIKSTQQRECRPCAKVSKHASLSMKTITRLGDVE